MSTLFSPIRADAPALPNRIVMVPLTHNRAPGAVPTPLNAPDKATFYGGEKGYTDYPVLEAA